LTDGFTQSLPAFLASLYRYARALCHDAAQAEELVQETCKRALAARRQPAADAPDETRRWLFTILRHVWLNQVRDRLHEPATGLECEGIAAAGMDSPESILLRKLLQYEVRHAVESLPPLFREVIVLRDIEDLSYAEIAEVLECPKGTVMSRLARARGMLRRALIKAAPAKESRKQ
jgi:RNA polymerase sigma-70 factor, ECF subfamily